jgi:hypothetical protein
LISFHGFKEFALSNDARAAWSKDMKDELQAGRMNGCVGTMLLSETEKVRIWNLRIPARSRFSFHCHALNYFWTALNSGRTRNYFEDGRVVDAEVLEGQTQHKSFAYGESMVHSVENLCDYDLCYTTVEFLDSPNAPLAVPDKVRREA